MTPDNPLDAAFALQTAAFEKESQPAREAFDELVRFVRASQTPTEKAFGFAFEHDELAFARGPYLITAKLRDAAISVGLRCPDGSSYMQAMCGAVSSLYKPTTSAKEAAEHLGNLMARVVEDRLL